MLYYLGGEDLGFSAQRREWDRHTHTQKDWVIGDGGAGCGQLEWGRRRSHFTLHKNGGGTHSPRAFWPQESSLLQTLRCGQPGSSRWQTPRSRWPLRSLARWGGLLSSQLIRHSISNFSATSLNFNILCCCLSIGTCLLGSVLSLFF